MTSEEWQTKYEHLVKLATRMRYHQEQFKRYRATDDRDRAKQLERQVDNILREENKKRKSGQKEIF